MGKMTDQKYKNYINELSERTMTMTNKVKLVLSSEEYVGLVGELAERKLLALDTVMKQIKLEMENELNGVVYHTDNSGGTHFSDWAQDEFNKEVDEIENILAEAGIFKEVT